MADKTFETLWQIVGLVNGGIAAAKAKDYEQALDIHARAHDLAKSVTFEHEIFFQLHMTLDALVFGALDAHGYNIDSPAAELDALIYEIRQLEKGEPIDD